MSYVYARGKKLWIGYRDQDGVERQQASGLDVGQESKAQKVVEQIEARIKAGHTIVPSGPVTVAAYFQKWIEQRGREVRDFKNDRSRFRDHIMPRLGSMEIAKVRTRNVKELVRELKLGGDLAPRTIHKVYGLCHKFFADAASDELIDANPCTLTKRELPKMLDKDPTWRSSAVFSRDEVEQLISDERVPEDRRTLYAILFLGGARIGEVSALRWSDLSERSPLRCLLILRQWDTKARSEVPATKSGVPREVPVHPVLAKLLAEWKLGGWSRTYGRLPGPNDLISPNPFVPGKGRRIGGPEAHRRSDTVWDALGGDCELLGLRHRRTHDARRTFISLARADGGREDLLKWVTHGRPAGIMNVYSEFPWEALCAEVAKLRISLDRGEVIALPKAVGSTETGGSDLQSDLQSSQGIRIIERKGWSRRELKAFSGVQKLSWFREDTARPRGRCQLSDRNLSEAARILRNRAEPLSAYLLAPRRRLLTGATLPTSGPS